ncbi:hypothetical protein F4802DRAFT_584905 [Xylaria palmicola]|nr:hypothetical protein F4802DRAFT_584905 [Xylaria palmicola]
MYPRAFRRILVLSRTILLGNDLAQSVDPQSPRTLSKVHCAPRQRSGQASPRILPNREKVVDTLLLRLSRLRWDRTLHAIDNNLVSDLLEVLL